MDRMLPSDPLIELVLGCRLGVGVEGHPSRHRVGPIASGGPGPALCAAARWVRPDAQGSRARPRIRYEGTDAHLGATPGTHERKHSVAAGEPSH